MSDDAPTHEDAALVAVLTEQVGQLNTLVTRFRLRANAAETAAQELRAEIAVLRDDHDELLVDVNRLQEALDDARGANAQQVLEPAPAAAPADRREDRPVGRGEISVSLDGGAPPATKAIAADIDALDELLGEVRLL